MSHHDDVAVAPRDDADLQDALQELIESGERPDAAALEEIVARHPRHASELTDFAVEWALQELLPEAAAIDEAASAVPAAMRRFQARIEELEELAPASLSDGVTPARPWPEEAGNSVLANLRGDASKAIDPFADRTPAELKGVAAALGLDKTLVAKLRDRKIVAETVPPALRDGLAAQLEVPPAAIVAHLAQPAAVYAGASFKAAGKPEAGPKESFGEAVRRSFLATQEKARWLASDQD